MTLDDAVLTLSGFQAIRLLAESAANRPMPDFLFGPCSAETMKHFHNDRYTPPLSIYVVQNMKVIGPWFETGTLLSRDDICFSCTGIALDPKTPQSLERLEAHELALNNGAKTVRHVAGQSLLLATNGHQIYGHWLVDFLPKLYLLDLAGIKPGKIKILLPTNMADFGAQYLALLGFKPENIITYHPDREMLIAEELIIPTTLRWGGRASPLFADAISYLNQTIDSFNRVPVLTANKRVFLSRVTKEATWRPLLNQEIIEDLAIEAGLSITYPETLSLIDQVSLFRGVRRVIGQYGSALHGTIFSRPGVVVGGLHGPPPAAFDALQSGIGERLGQTTGYIFGSPVSTGSSEFAMTIEQNEFSECLASYFS